ncbi:MAG: hypothetical protein ACREIB_12525 [Pseudomonadota bacterium]
MTAEQMSNISDKGDPGVEATFLDALRRIARGRPDNGLPLNRETARQIARSVLIEHDKDW